jgi:hypothetical protein
VQEEDLPLAQQLAPDGALICFSSYGPTKVSTGCRSSGGVRIVDISRMPVSDISSVRGIGVALIVSTSTAVRICLRNSLCSTPKRCSSSTMTSPRSLNCCPSTAAGACR